MTSATGQVLEFLHDRILSHTSYWANPPLVGVNFVISGRIGTKREMNPRGREWTVENESSICAFSGKSGGEFVGKDQNWLCLYIFRQIWSGVGGKEEWNSTYCAGVGATWSGLGTDGRGSLQGTEKRAKFDVMRGGWSGMAQKDETSRTWQGIRNLEGKWWGKPNFSPCKGPFQLSPCGVITEKVKLFEGKFQYWAHLSETSTYQSKEHCDARYWCGI